MSMKGVISIFEALAGVSEAGSGEREPAAEIPSAARDLRADDPS